MAYLRLSACVVILALATVDGSGDDELKPAVEKVVAAAGGEKLTGVKAWTQTTRLKTAGRGVVTYRDFVELPDRFRHEIEFEEGGKGGTKTTRIYVVNGDKGWDKAVGGIADGEGGESKPDDIAWTKWYVRTAGVFAPVIPVLPGVKASPLGESKIGGRNVVGVKVETTDPVDWAERLCYDKETGRLVRREGVAPPRKKAKMAAVNYDDYRDLGGFPVARKQVAETGGKVDGEWEVVEFKPADKLDRKLFERP